MRSIAVDIRRKMWRVWEKGGNLCLMQRNAVYVVINSLDYLKLTDLVILPYKLSNNYEKMLMIIVCNAL